MWIPTRARWLASKTMLFKSLSTAIRELRRYGSSMIDSAIIVPDASALLALYEYDPETREELVEALTRCMDRIWVANRTRREVLRHYQLVRSRNRSITLAHAQKMLPGRLV